MHIDVVGFDGTVGLPEPRNHRDHPDLYTFGTFEMVDWQVLVDRPPTNTSLVIRPLAEPVPQFLSECNRHEPIGFISLDVDYYHGAVNALKIVDDHPEWYLPTMPLYLDDVWCERHNLTRCGSSLLHESPWESDCSRTPAGLISCTRRTSLIILRGSPRMGSFRKRFGRPVPSVGELPRYGPSRVTA